ncbi:MAG: NUDIX hydrolase, partial [Aestuariibacter sp.]|nr:NUDIX hydrolase [Aestuariibacter sp.]
MYGRNPNGLVYSYYYPEGEVGEYGGGVDPGEDPAQAAAREYKEETGYDVNNV